MHVAAAVAAIGALLTVHAPPAPARTAELVPEQLLVRFEPATPPATVAAILASADAHGEGAVPGIGVEIVSVAAGSEADAMARLMAAPAVERVERDVVVRALETTPNDPFWTAQTGSQEISTPGAWDLTRGSQSTLVAVLDTGVDASHPDLVGSTQPGYDFVNSDADPADDNGHGTETAGVIAARGNNSAGVAGVCWSCSILPVKVLGPTGEGTTAALASGLVWAADRGARVINMSLGGPATTQTLAEAIRYAAGKGVILVAAAGNDASTAPSYPAAYPEVVSVAATTPAKTLYPFSNRGDWVRLAAPGCNPTPFLAGAYMLFCGTSSSAPLVSGVAALGLSLWPQASKGVVDGALERSAKALAEPGVRHGQVDAFGALTALQEVLGPAGSSSEPAVPPAAAAPPAQPPAAPPASPPAPKTPLAAPKAVRAPTLAGQARVGRLLRARPGPWTGAGPIRFRYRWYRCRNARAGCRTIPGAARLRYRIARKDRGSFLRFSVTARNAAGVVFRISRPTARVRG